MTAFDFTKEIGDQVSSIKVEFSYPNDGTAFGHFVLRECLSKVLDFGDVAEPDLDCLVKQSVTDGKDDNGVDAVIVGNNGKVINFFQFKYSNWNQYDYEEFLKTKTFLDGLLLEASNQDKVYYNTRLEHIVETKIKPALKDHAGIRFYYVGSYFEQELKSVVENLKQRYQRHNKDVSFENYDYDELSVLLHNTRLPKNQVSLYFAEGESFIRTHSSFHLSSTDVKARSFVGSIYADSLRKVLDNYGCSLFNLDVRYFKGLSGEINNSIKKEYQKGNRSNFWFLNNGINAICRGFEIKENELSIDSLQIVNGCQTSKALQKVLDVDPNISILFRLTEIKDSTVIDDISSQIAIASNRQNPISNRDLHANDDIQSKISQLLDEKHIFYDFKEGSWREAEKKKYKIDKYKWNKIKNVDLAVSYMSLFLQTPVLSKGREKIAFSDDADYYSEIFDGSHGPEKLVKRLMLAYRLRELVDKSKGKNTPVYGEFLNASNSTDITLALLAISLLKIANLSFNSCVEEIKEKLATLNADQFIDENYNLSLRESVEKYCNIITNKVNTHLEAMKDLAADKKDQFNSTNWLKLQDNYRKIVEKVVPVIKNTHV